VFKADKLHEVGESNICSSSAKDVECGFHATCSEVIVMVRQESISFLAGVHTGKYEMIPCNLSGILTFSSGMYMEWVDNPLVRCFGASSTIVP
jgi:hypothetical protein